MMIFICIVLGLAAGVLSGLVGLGGGILILPVLIYGFGMSQHLAQGTALATLLPPVGIFAVLTYYKNGYVNFKVAGLICVGFVLGAYLGSKYAVSINPRYLKIICGVMFIVIGVKMVFFKH